LEEVELGQVGDLLAADRALEGEVEVVQRLHLGEAGAPDPGVAAVGLSGGHLLGQDLGQVVLVVPALGAGPLGQGGGQGGDPWRLEGAGQERHLAGDSHLRHPRRRTQHQAVVATQIDRVQRQIAGLQASAGRSGQAQRPGMTGVEHDVGWGVAALWRAISAPSRWTTTAAGDSRIWTLRPASPGGTE
jgi:hypothetical protein